MQAPGRVLSVGPGLGFGAEVRCALCPSASGPKIADPTLSDRLQAAVSPLNILNPQTPNENLNHYKTQAIPQLNLQS